MVLSVSSIVITLLLSSEIFRISSVDGAGARSKPARQSVEVIRATLHEYTSTGRMNDVIAYLDQVEDSYGTLLIDDVIPSLYSYKAIALYNGLKVEEAEKMLKIAVHHYPNDTRSWINLGEMQVQTFKLDEAYQSFSAALKAGDQAALPRALRTKGWATSWQDFESLSYSLERKRSSTQHGTTSELHDSEFSPNLPLQRSLTAIELQRSTPLLSHSSC